MKLYRCMRGGCLVGFPPPSYRRAIGNKKGGPEAAFMDHEVQPYFRFCAQ
jgi:hypothetical protein